MALGGVSFEYLKILPRCRTQVQEARAQGGWKKVDNGIRSFAKFFISQWPEVPEQLFRLLLRPVPLSFFDPFVSLLRAQALFLVRS